MKTAEVNHKLIDAKTVSKVYFGGARKPANILIDASKNFLPSLRIGKRVYFDMAALDEYFNAQLAASKERMAAMQAEVETKEMEEKEVENTSKYVCPGIKPIAG